MTLTATPPDDEIGTLSAEIQQPHQQSLHSLQKLRQSLNPSSLIPDGNVECLRFYKGLAGRDRRQSAAAAVSAAAATRRARRRWPKRRPRSQAGDWERHNCSEGDQGLTKPSLASCDKELLTRLIKTSTLDTRSPDTAASPVSSSSPQEDPMTEMYPPKIQYIFYKGRMQPVEVMKWPEQLRIPTTERYRLEEPMKRLYGKHSVLSRLLRALERSRVVAGSVDSSDIRQPIPLLPRHMTESTKRRLKLWYKPMESSGEFHAVGTV